MNRHTRSSPEQRTSSRWKFVCAAACRASDFGRRSGASRANSGFPAKCSTTPRAC